MLNAFISAGYSFKGYIRQDINCRVMPAAPVCVLSVLTALLVCASGLGVVATAQNPSTREVDSAPIMIFSYFTGNGETGVYLKASRDGLVFSALNNAEPVFQPPESWPADQRLTRDPSIIYDGTWFHMVWTTNWSGRVFGYARSADLKSWRDVTMVQPFAADLPEEHQPRNVWAPEIHYDPVHDDFFVVFSSTTPAMLARGARGRDTHGHNHRMYVVRTDDFVTFSPAKLFFDPGYSSIDGQLYYDRYGSPNVSDDRWIMVYKHELMPEHDGKNLRWVSMNPITGDFSDYSAPIVGPGSGVNEDWVEGPTLMRNLQGMWYLYFDAFADGYYGVVRSADLKHWEDLSDALHIDVAHPRHGSFLWAPEHVVGFDMQGGSEP